jgi:hypothetical protein
MLVLLILLLPLLAAVGYYQIEDRWQKCEARGGHWNTEKAEAGEVACSDGKGLPKIL